jgi:TetR/AcrR family transcriptional regulator
MAKSPRPQKNDQQTEDKILQAARTVFIRHGTAGARMQEIAEEAGVNQALLHYYFRSKERLSAAVFQQVARQLFPRLFQTLGSDLPLDEKVDLIVNAYIDTLSQNRFMPAYVLSELHHHPERAEQMLTSGMGGEPSRVLAPVVAKLKSQIDAEVKAGRIRPISPQELIVNMLSLCVFPFAARPLFAVALGLDEAHFSAFIKQRRKNLPAFIRMALRP